MSKIASHSLPRLFASSVAIDSSIRSENIASSIVSEVPTIIAPHPVLMVNAKNDSKRPFLGGVDVTGLSTQASYASGQTFLRNTQPCPHRSSTALRDARRNDRVVVYTLS